MNTNWNRGLNYDEQRNILLTGGRAPVTLELARLFAAAGHKVLVADSLKHHLCRYSRAVSKSFWVPPPRVDPAGFIAAIERILQQETIHLLIPTCEEIFYVSSGLARLTPWCPVFAESLEKLTLLHNKWHFISQVQQLGLPTPKTWLLESKQELQNLLAGSTLPKLVLKPVYSRFASQVQILSPPVTTIPDLEIHAQKTWVAQEFITGTHYCTYSIAHQGKLTAHAAYPTIYTAGTTREGTGSCVYFEAIAHPPLLAWVKTFVAAQNFTGQIAFDFIQTAEGTIYPLECNPRSISAIHLFDASDHLERAFFNTTTQLIEPQPQSKAMIALAMLSYGLAEAIATHRLADWRQKFCTSQDVIFRWSDPVPLFHLGIIMLQFWQMSRKDNISLQQASTQDIEWDGEELWEL